MCRGFLPGNRRSQGDFPMSRSSQWKREFSVPLHALQNELNRLFEGYWNAARVGPAQPPPTDLETAAWTPAIDIIETPQEILVLVELPGVDPASIDLSVTGNVLSLRGEKPMGDLPEGT